MFRFFFTRRNINFECSIMDLSYHCTDGHPGFEHSATTVFASLPQECSIMNCLTSCENSKSGNNDFAQLTVHIIISSFCNNMYI
jgi:hypothetical protein